MRRDGRTHRRCPPANDRYLALYLLYHGSSSPGWHDFLVRDTIRFLPEPVYRQQQLFLPLRT
jgi:hypothetical protein